MLDALRTDLRVPWEIAPLTSATGAERAELERLLPARLVADAWDVARRGRERPIRLELRTPPSRPDAMRELLELLAGPEVGAAPFVAATLTANHANWQWPVRIGLLAGPRLAQLRDRLAAQTSWPELVEWVEVEGAHTPCDLLLMDAAPTGMPLEPLAPLLDDLEPGCVLVFGTAPALDAETIRGFLRANRVAAWGVGFVRLPLQRAGRYLHELVRELSHDATLDVALQRAAGSYLLRKGQQPATPPLLVAGAGALDEARVRRYGGRLVEALATANGGAAAIAPEIGTPEALRDTLRDRAEWRYESANATRIARAARVTRARAAERPAKVRPRRVQVEVSERIGRRRVTSRLRPHADYDVAVSIRYPKRGAVQARASIDLTSLPQDHRRHRLLVVFQELGTGAVAQRGAVMIRGDEESTVTRFGFRTAATGMYRARIIIAYRNRILQMVRFEADLSGRRRDSADARRRPQRLLVESNARPSMGDLAHRRTFDFAVVANHGVAGDPVVGVLKAGRYRQLATGEISQDLAWFEATLTQLATRGDPLMAPRTQRLMRDLAIRGTRLHNHLASWQRGLDPLPPKHGRVQIVDGSPDAFFPLEFVYDRGLPTDDARLCPAARKALLEGACPASCAPPGAEASVICPLGFWGLSRVVERHAFRPGRDIGSQESRIVAEPATGRNELRPFAAAAYAASDLADAVRPGSVELVAEALAAAIGRPTRPVRTWAGWLGAVRKQAPPMLVVICHTAAKRSAGQSIMQLEIGAKGKKEWLDVDAIADQHVLGPRRAPNPIVLLIGCSTAIERVQFSNAVARLQDHGAAIVLSTLATVLGEQAAVTTAGLIGRLAELPRSRDVTFGDALRKARCELLAADIPTAMALVAFGDADWRLARRR
jgi:hypothetical protein